MTRPSYYEILGLPQDNASLNPAQVKTAYRNALLAHHPDKNSGNGRHRPAAPGGKAVSVDEIALAYKTLSETSLKAEYDRWLASNSVSENSDASGGRIHHTGLETVDLDDLNFEEQSQSWTRTCRCGAGGFVATEEELEKNLEDRELIVGCRGCSLWLRVLFSVED